MATVFLLIRHGSNDALGKRLAGRDPGLSLNAQGANEAAGLSARLSAHRISALYSSPLERARETAAPLAAALHLSVQIDEALQEIDFGRWTGKTFAELASDPLWPLWVEQRSEARAPGGESICEAQQRITAAIERLRARHAGGTVALVSHGDVIKAALAHVLGLSLDYLERFEIAPASISTIAAGEGGAQVRCMNVRGALPAP